MKKILLAILLFSCTIFANACSCDRFDIDTYTSAVRNYNNSTGLDYKLTVVTEIEGETSYTQEESLNKYQISTTRKVDNFSSNLKKYQILTHDQMGNSAPQKIYELNRYYKGEEGKFYTNEISINVNNKQAQNITYEDKYDEESPYHLNNLTPVFDSRYISDFVIVKDSSSKGSSVATFKAACPALFECNEDVIEYKVYINKNYYFSKIEFTVNTTIQKTVINENNAAELKDFVKTMSYKYEFNQYNSKVSINFPSDLINY